MQNKYKEIDTKLLTILPLSTPFELWMRYKDNVEHLRVWGCEVYPHITDEDQYDKDMEICFLIGYPQGEKGYLL